VAAFDNLSGRERQLLGGLGVVLGFLLITIVPWRTSVWLSDKQKANADQRQRIEDVGAARIKLAARRAALGDVNARYMNKAPPLGVLVDGAAKASGLDVASQSEAPPVPRGKNFSERSTKLSITKTGLRALSDFMEKVETSGYPIAITAFDLTKRIEPDAYTVNLTISAFDRVETTPAAAGGQK
jgi:general secretion pathway protein M